MFWKRKKKTNFKLGQTLVRSEFCFYLSTLCEFCFWFGFRFFLRLRFRFRFLFISYTTCKLTVAMCFAVQNQQLIAWWRPYLLLYSLYCISNLFCIFFKNIPYSVYSFICFFQKYLLATSGLLFMTGCHSELNYHVRNVVMKQNESLKRHIIANQNVLNLSVMNVKNKWLKHKICKDM